MQDGYRCRTKEIFIVWMVSCRYSNECRFGSCTINQERRFENHATCTGYPDGQANCTNFSAKGTQRGDSHATFGTCVADSSMCIKHIINPLQHRVKVIRRLKTEDSMEPIRISQGMKSGSIDVSDQCMSIDRQPDQKPKLLGLTTCSRG
jgi:hypothetical protein